MKYILKTPLFIICLIIMGIIGYFIGLDISKDFATLYIYKLTCIPVRYNLLIIIVFSNYLSFKQLNCVGIILRNKSLFNFFLKSLKVEGLIVFLLFIFLHIPILYLNHEYFFRNVFLIIKIILNGILISLVIISIIKIVDIRWKNRAISSGIVLGMFTIIDIVLEYFNFFVVDDVIFDLSYLFILPYSYEFYFIIAIFLALLIAVLTFTFVFLSLKKDYLLGNIYEKK